MKRILLVAFLASLFQKAHTQVVLNAESGNRNIDAANCWVFGGVTYTNASTRISGNWSMQTGQASTMSPTAFWIKSPWVRNLGSQLSIKLRLSAANGTTRGIYVSYIPVNKQNTSNYEGSINPFYTYAWPSINTNIVELTISIPTEIQNSQEPVKFLISFIGTGGNSRIIADDFIIPGTYAADPANGCIPNNVITDTDGDGVADNDDDFPNDPTRAFRNFSPAANTFGTFAYEDLWPALGDYDFNDLVVDYQMEYATNADNLMVDLKIKLYIRAIGASIPSGFGISFDNISASSVASVTGMRLFDGYINIAANGLEAGHDNVVIIPFDNAIKCVNWGSQPTFNTTPGYQPGTSDTITITILFNQPVPVARIQIGGQEPAVTTKSVVGPPTVTVNPFMIKGKIRGQEIHLPGMPPTALANTQLFGTIDDDTNPGQGRYYVTKNNLPWAIHLPVKFDYPTEKTDILKAYKKLADWAQSNGELFTDWYLNLPGYRDDKHLF
ncbi:hypothetical protein JCM31826_15270 [Thermaurantimonas aggregans]|uniref:DUF4842 domain-containing protein n=1 Tax=Thermaurantimonas aggregans TaxID=2173829 RepID=A0A401XLZ4_9FLAO|nr:LruC domain-containing protein [Thermaurantimonas aggregans]MCX8148056.1 LruC domain-containing protein [Thermaurantimonas aggregans]GCD78045.1 hypothetical protein JCM31826_15270 [Thermaurantimonas aggregans]